MKLGAAVVVCLSVALANSAAAWPGGGSAAKPAREDSERATPPPGPGDPRRIVAVLDVAVNGVPSEVKEQFQSSLDAQVDPKRFWIAPRAYVRAKMANSTKWTEGCVIGDCLREVKVQTRADLVLLVAINGSGTSFGSVVTLVRTDSGRVLSQESERCDVCTVSEALTTAALATIRLLNAVPDQLPDEVADHRADMHQAVEPLRGELRRHARHRRHVGMAISIAGVAVGTIGAVVYFAAKSHDAGLAMTAAGGGLALGGVAVLAF